MNDHPSTYRSDTLGALTTHEAQSSAAPTDLYEMVAAVQRDAAETEATISGLRRAMDELQARIAEEEQTFHAETAQQQALADTDQLGSTDETTRSKGTTRQNEAVEVALLAGVRAALAEEQAAAEEEKRLLSVELDAIPLLLRTAHGRGDGRGANEFEEDTCRGGGSDTHEANGTTVVGATHAECSETTGGTDPMFPQMTSTWRGGAIAFAATVQSLLLKLHSMDSAQATIIAAAGTAVGEPVSEFGPLATRPLPSIATLPRSPCGGERSASDSAEGRRRVRITFEADADLERVRAVSGINDNRRRPCWRDGPVQAATATRLTGMSTAAAAATSLAGASWGTGAASDEEEDGDAAAVVANAMPVLTAARATPPAATTSAHAPTVAAVVSAQLSPLSDRAVLRVEIPAGRLRRAVTAAATGGDRSIPTAPCSATGRGRHVRGQKTVWRLGEAKPSDPHSTAEH